MFVYWLEGWEFDSWVHQDVITGPLNKVLNPELYKNVIKFKLLLDKSV